MTANQEWRFLFRSTLQKYLQLFAPPPEGEVDPLVALREKELEIKATDIQRKALEFDARMEFEQNREEGRQELTAERINSSEDIAQLRATVAREKMRKDYKVGN